MELRQLFGRLTPESSPKDSNDNSNFIAKGAHQKEGSENVDLESQSKRTSDPVETLHVRIPSRTFRFGQADDPIGQDSPGAECGALLKGESPRLAASGNWTPRKRRANVFSIVRRGSDDGDMDNGALPYGEIPLPRREIVRNFVEDSALGIILDIIQVVLSTIACILYVVGTYDDDFEKGDLFMIEAEVAMGVYFFLHFLLNWYISEDRCWYLFTLEALLDIVTILPVFLSLFIEKIDIISVGILRSIKVLRVFRILHAYRLVRMTAQGVMFEAMQLLFSILAIMFCAAGLIHAAEYDDQDLEFHDAFYLIFITLTTIGYGDVKPITALGQYLIIIVVTVALLVIPRQLTRLQTMRWKKKKTTLVFENVNGKDHVVVTGPASCMTYSSFEDFWENFIIPRMAYSACQCASCLPQSQRKR